METWIHEVVSMMADPGTPSDVIGGGLSTIKKEEISFTECSPSNSDIYSPTTTVMPEVGIDFNERLNQQDYQKKIRCSTSPERQYCSSTTQPHMDSGLGNLDDSTKEDMPRRLCLVCGDVASGFHYGVASCEACKAFFKRTIQGNIEYTCPANGECEINKRRRKACQACRFRKCLRSGMLKEGVRLDRVRGGRQKYRRNPDMPYQIQVVLNQRPSLTLEDIKLINILTQCEPDILEMNAALDVSKYRSLSILSDLYDRELVGIIGWAKQIPGFTEMPLTDQMRMLQSTWAEILTLTLAYRSLPLLSLGRLKFASDFTMDDKQCRECGAGELFQIFTHIAERIDNLSIMKEEYYLIKALVLTNSDARVDECHSLKKFRDSVVVSLIDAIGILRPSTAFFHTQQLLLCLPALRQADHMVRKFWSEVRRQDLVPMNKLFLEMLEACNR